MYKIINFLAFIGCIFWLLIDQSPEPVVVLLLTIAGFFRDDVHGIIGKKVFTLTPKNQLIRDLESCRFSFINQEFINPLILDDLSGWLSDTGDQIVSINISESNKSMLKMVYQPARKTDLFIEKLLLNWPRVMNSSSCHLIEHTAPLLKA